MIFIIYTSQYYSDDINTSKKKKYIANYMNTLLFNALNYTMITVMI